MAKYRKIDVRLWNDADFRSLSDDGKLAFLFLLTHPHLTSVGAMRGNLAGLTIELGWSAKPNESLTVRLSEALSKAFAKGMIQYDESACFIWLPNFLSYNKPESPNVVKGWHNALDQLPECELKNELIHTLKDQWHYLKDKQHLTGTVFSAF